MGIAAEIFESHLLIQLGSSLPLPSQMKTLLQHLNGSHCGNILPRAPTIRRS